MIVDKREMLAIHEGEFEAWERLLARLSPAQLSDPSLPAGLSVKDTLAHLGAWQGRTIARLEAALHGHEPRFPTWGLIQRAPKPCSERLFGETTLKYRTATRLRPSRQRGPTLHGGDRRGGGKVVGAAPTAAAVAGCAA